MGRIGCEERRMNNTLDRLKALNSKLEEKLSEKKKALVTPKERIASGVSTVASEEKESPKVPLRKKETKKVSATATPESTENHSIPVEVKQELHERLIRSLGIDVRQEPVRSENLARFTELYLKLDIRKKVPEIEDIFIYKAMNISGIGLKEEDFGQIRAGKYVQVIAITYEPDKNGKKKAKNISLGYFGKAEALEGSRKNEVIEFVLRWRYEKAFQNLEHYRLLLEKVLPRESLF